MKKEIIRLCSIIIFLFSIQIYIYDMIKNNKIRMICRSMNESYIMYLSWFFIVTTIVFITLLNKHIPNKYTILFYIQFISLIICLEKDYNNRAKKTQTKKIWKYLHYFFSLTCMLSIIQSTKMIQNTMTYHMLVFCFIIFMILHTSTDKFFNNVSIILELIIIYSGIYSMLRSTYRQIIKPTKN